MANKAMRKLGLGMSMLMTVSQMSGMTVLAADDGWGSADPEETMEVSENGSETFGDFLEDKFDAEADMDETEEQSEPLDTDVLVDEMEDMDVLLAESGNCGTSDGRRGKVEWELDDAGTLVITATGNNQKMLDFDADNVPWDKSKIEKIVFKGNIVYIGAYAFYGCENLKEVEIPDTITGIGEYAFGGCTSLSEIVLPKSLEEMGKSVFADCTGLIKAAIEDSALKELDATFEGCTSLQSVVLGSYETGSYNDEDIEGYWSSLQTIGNRAFYNCSDLTEVILTPELFNWNYYDEEDQGTWTVIGEDAFRGCAKLETFQFPIDTIAIGESAFRDDVSLNHVVLAETTEKIGAGAFYNDTAMEDFYIPVSVAAIGKDAFHVEESISASRLMDLYYSGTEEQWKNLAADGIESGNELITGGENVSYRANRYYNTNLHLPAVDNVQVVYEDGKMQISWHPGIMKDGDQELGPVKYEIYMNIGSTTEEQWKTHTPEWKMVASLTSGQYDYAPENINPGDVCNIRVREYFNDTEGGMLSSAGSVQIPETTELTDKEIIASVEEKIKAIGTVEYKDACKAKIDAARSAYDKLTDEQKKQVSNLKTLTDAEAEYARLKSIPAKGTALVENKNGEKVYYKDGKAQTNYSGLAEADGSWYYVDKGVVAEKKSGYVDYNESKFLVVNGKLQNNANGLVQDPDHQEDWYYLAGGQAQTQYSGLVQYDGKWFYVNEGELDTNLAAYVEYDGGLFFVAAGRIMTEVNGLAQDPNGEDWYYLANGQVQTQYTGLAQYDGEWFYVQKGRLAKEYITMVEYDGSMFCSINGMIGEFDSLSETDAVIALCNNERRVQGLDLLEKTEEISAAAQARSEELPEHFSHERPNGESCFTMLKEYGVSYGWTAENIAAGQQTAQGAVNWWMNSDGHRAAILNEGAKYIGVGMTRCEGGYGNYGIYWSEFFTK